MSMKGMDSIILCILCGDCGRDNRFSALVIVHYEVVSVKAKLF